MNSSPILLLPGVMIIWPSGQHYVVHMRFLQTLHLLQHLQHCFAQQLCAVHSNKAPLLMADIQLLVACMVWGVAKVDSTQGFLKNMFWVDAKTQGLVTSTGGERHLSDAQLHFVLF